VFLILALVWPFFIAEMLGSLPRQGVRLDEGQLLGLFAASVWIALPVLAWVIRRALPRVPDRAASWAAAYILAFWITVLCGFLALQVFLHRLFSL
jgi:hypothetical protein